MGVFDGRVNLKPFEYPLCEEFWEAIQDSFWTHRDQGYASDVHDYKVNLTPAERSAVTRAMLAISQIEVAVKEFWGKLGTHLPKPEFKGVGYVFADSELRHMLAYSHLLGELGLNDEFASALTAPQIRGRVAYLSKALALQLGDRRDFVRVLTLFSLFVEGVSLFSQFAVMKSLNKHRTLMKNIDTVVQATQQEEQTHMLFGIYLVNLIKDESPEWFDAAFYDGLRAACDAAYAAESAIVDWMMEGGDLPYLTAAALKEFLKDRFNWCLTMVGARPQFAVDAAALEPIAWFSEELLALINPDFFNKRSTSYSRGGAPITAEEAFLGF